MIGTRSPRAGDIEHIAEFAAEPWAREIAARMDLAPVYANPHTLIIEADGERIAAGGYLDMGHGIAVAWAMVGQVQPHLFVPLCRLYRAHLRRAPFHWIEAHCAEGLEQQFRWVRCLGFVPLDGAHIVAPDGRKFKRFIFRG